MSVVDRLLDDLPIAEHGVELYIGDNWILSVIRDMDGVQRAGVASTPVAIEQGAGLGIGHQRLDDDPLVIAGWLRSQHEMDAACGLATLNALLKPSAESLKNVDAADWLSAQCVNRSIAIIGRFPFIEDEIRPFARQVWVFEHEPEKHEYGPDEMVNILPQADIVAITGSTLINHTLDSILSRLSDTCLTAVLGPSTPLSEQLFDCNIDVLFGVQVVAVRQTIESIMDGKNFQKLKGLERVSLFNPRLTG
jgi:hypothetical protein